MIMFIALIVFILVKSSNRQKVYILGLRVVISLASILLNNKYYYKTPFVLGTSSDPVFSIACLMARANALKADSALHATNL